MAHTSPSVLRTALAVAAKELRTSFRDRQVWIYTVVLPLLMYPVLFWVMLQAANVIEGRRQVREVELALVVEDPGDAASIEQAVELGRELQRWIEEQSSPAAEDVDANGEAPAEARLPENPEAPAAAEEPESEPIVLRGLDAPWDPERAAAALARPTREATDELEAIDAYLVVGAGAPADGADPDAAALRIVHDSSRANSVLAEERLAERLGQLGLAARATGAESVGLDLESLAPFEVRRLSTAGGTAAFGLLLSMMLPMMLVIMSVMGAFYPAVDLTAGEIERKTQETTLLLPVPRTGIQLGKLLAVAATGGLAAVMNLAGIALAAEHLLGMMGAGNRFQVELSLPHLALTVPFLLAFLLFVAAVLVSIASFAKTFKQGQSLLGSAQMLFMLPAIGSSLPGLVLSPVLAGIPVVGLCMALRTILRGAPFAELPWLALALAFFAQLALAGLALWIGLRLLDRELDSGDERKPLKRALALLRRRSQAPN